MSPWAGRAVAVLAVLTSAAVCSPHAPHSPPAAEGRFPAPVGVTVKDGQLEVLAEPCGEQEVTDVVVFDSTADSAFARNDQVIWSVRLPLDARRASRTERITLGRVPAGFEELTPLKKDDGDELVVDVNNDQLGFDRSELVEGQVLTDQGLRTEEQFFEDFVPRACPQPAVPTS